MIANAEDLEVSVYEQLNIRQKAFVDQYIVLQNGYKAAVAAGYSAKSCRTTAYDMLERPTIKKAIDERLKAIGASSRLTPERIRAKIAEKAFDDTLRPEAQLKALELAGKATPGTFEPLPTPTNTFNFLTIMEEDSQRIPPSVVDVPSATITQHTNSVEGVVTQHTLQSPADRQPPQTGPLCDNTPTPKIVEPK